MKQIQFFKELISLTATKNKTYKKAYRSLNKDTRDRNVPLWPAENLVLNARFIYLAYAKFKGIERSKVEPKVRYEVNESHFAEFEIKLNAAFELVKQIESCEASQEDKDIAKEIIFETMTSRHIKKVEVSTNNNLSIAFTLDFSKTELEVNNREVLMKAENTKPKDWLSWKKVSATVPYSAWNPFRLHSFVAWSFYPSNSVSDMKTSLLRKLPTLINLEVK